MEQWMKQVISEIKEDDLPQACQEVAEIIGVEATIKLTAHFGGMRVYFPGLGEMLRARRDDLIRTEFTGLNHRDLARKYGLSETWIREIVQAKALRLQQPSLFD